MSQPTAAHPDEPTRSVVLAAIWRSRWLILVAVLVAGMAGYLLSKSQPESYAAESRVILGVSQNFDPLGNQTGSDAARFVADQVSILQTSAVLQPAADALGDGITVPDLFESLAVSSSGGSSQIIVRTTAPDPQAAADRANAVVAAYRGLVAGQVAARTDQASRATTDQAVTNQILAQAASYGDGVDVVEPAAAPGAPESPNPLRDAGLLAGVGALVVIGLALIRRAPAEPSAWTAESAPVRVLGTVPMRTIRRGREHVVDRADHALALVALDYARREHAGPILVTEAGHDGRAASVAHGLGVSAAGLGRRVLLVDADPAARELVLRAGVGAPGRSLRSLGADVSSEALVPVPLDGMPDAALHLSTLGGDASGPADDVRLAATLNRLAGSFDLVLIQSGPVETDPLAFALVGQAAAVVAAVGTNEGPEQLKGLRERLDVAQRPLIGVVRTRLARGRGPRVRPGRSSGDPPARVGELVATNRA